MQTELEIKAIKKRTADMIANATQIFGLDGDKVTGNSVDKEYDINGADSKKGGESNGSLVDHLNQKFDLSTGGDAEDTKARKRQQGYVIPGLITYSAENIYSDADNIKVDISPNIGNVKIY
jgi:hypothetical protein